MTRTVAYKNNKRPLMMHRIKPVSVKTAQWQHTRINMNITILFCMLVASVLAAPTTNSQFPADTYYYLLKYPVPVGYNNAQIRSMPAISTTLTNTVQGIANWQLLQLRRKWILIICLADPTCPTVPFPAKHPWAPARSYSPLFDIENWAAENSEAQDLAEELTRKDAEPKSTAVLTSAANFNLAQWIWRWNIILCLVNPSCPHVNIPATKLNSRSDLPSFRVNMETLIALNENPLRGMVIPTYFAPQ